MAYIVEAGHPHAPAAVLEAGDRRIHDLPGNLHSHCFTQPQGELHRHRNGTARRKDGNGFSGIVLLHHGPQAFFNRVLEACPCWSPGRIVAARCPALHALFEYLLQRLCHFQRTK